MLQIKPNINQQSNCPHCGQSLIHNEVVWYGRFIGVSCQCPECGTKFLEDLHVGHAFTYPHTLDLTSGEFFATKTVRLQGEVWNRGWGDAWVKTFHNLNTDAIEITKEQFKPCQRVIILNCLDNLYGHCLLKLLNAQRHLDDQGDLGLIVIIPKFLRWMVPSGVAEVWTVGIPLRNGLDHYIAFNEFVQHESERFEEIYVSRAYSHPGRFDITRFTEVTKYEFDQHPPKITFIWREDRFWVAFLPWRALKRIAGIILPMLLLQNLKVVSLFKQIKSIIPQAQFAVTGLGTRTKFPSWIEDRRVDRFDEQIEHTLCKLYAESFLVIGIHGSNLLLPSGHAGTTIDLMPDNRWGNFAQDILYQESDPRLAAFRYRYLPYTIDPTKLAYVAAHMYLKKNGFYQVMTADRDELRPRVK